MTPTERADALMAALASLGVVDTGALFIRLVVRAETSQDETLLALLEDVMERTQATRARASMLEAS